MTNPCGEREGCVLDCADNGDNDEDNDCEDVDSLCSSSDRVLDRFNEGVDESSKFSSLPVVRRSYSTFISISTVLSILVTTGGVGE